MSTWSDLKNTPRLKEIYNTRIEIIKLIREFFWSQGFIETDTPVAVRLASQEPYLNPLPITIHDPNGKQVDFYLRTSPEYSLKKLLAAGYEKVFEIGKCFRDFESFVGNHNTEFTMVEWYRAPGKYQDIMDDTENLFKFIGKKLNKDKVQYKEKEINILEDWDRLSMKEVWQKFIGVNLDDYLQVDKMAELAKSKGYNIQENEPYEDIFYKIFLNEIESNLGNDRPVFVYDYPAQMSSLSRLCEHDNRYAERFELYVGGLELANAFGELTDAVEQEKRLVEDMEKRKQLGKETWPVDPDFINALAGLPAGALAQVGGIALGVDRMVVLFTGAKDLNETIFGSVKDQLI
ncbi:MAG: EF-P lysine aminoacylase GenX [Candidatus Magasanikbacteria bacterium RIFOXYD2_FULL_39_9]|uniref:EF-P lysine aminoacylase GenX n=1 Tax=Candidatus Magasanikbacteria bacterium RIFOXYD1_FULL_40_23 TaxID=1798705 RepID=A0A1F6P8C7_9BACT|nr:MAG: EF-P lysine aminoacylase GenX [Candidatus Magasanikbacteria bacterium RIFOXYD1_FULL_40_23]OGH93467.1 MAG: EF-P lysine aminoacylase GenX [Candidatus Magasanikbacteria bacterium RIFOXYD2_FULL_39_9]